MPANQLGRIDPAAKTALRELQEPGKPDIYLHLLTVFFSSSEEFMATLKKFSTGRDPELVKQTAHSWRSSAAAVGATGVAELCQKLEGVIAAGDGKVVTETIQELSDEYEAVKAELMKELPKN